MSRTPVKFAMLHSPVFLVGKSFSTQLDPLAHTGLRIEYDAEVDKLFIGYKGEEITMPSTSAVYWLDGEPKKREIVEAKPYVKPVLPSAQVESPQSHVHAGPGAGKTGRG